jgi:SPP1 Gp6-like portal protein
MTALSDLRQRCSMKLDNTVPRLLQYQSYYDGQPAILALLDTEERQSFRKFLDESFENWCDLVVNAVAERLQVVGFDWGGSSDTAWSIWQSNSMDADAELVQTDALVLGSGYVLVQPDDANPSGVSVTPESPFECTVLYEPGDRRKPIAGYKRITDYDQRITEILITPDQIATWAPDSNTGVPVIQSNPAGFVGLIEMQPQPRTKGAPRSELDAVMPIQDRIHTTIFNRLVATDFGAFRQIWATGVKIARQIITDADGVTHEINVKPFDIGANRLLVNEDPAGKFGAMPGDPLAGYLGAVQADIEALASITKTPPYYFNMGGRLANVSADAIKAAEAGLVCKVRRRMLHIGESWEQVVRLALQLVGDPGAADQAGQVLWADPETQSAAQLADALVKMAALGVPDEVLWAKWGASPREIDTWKKMQLANAQRANLFAPAVEPPATPGATPAPAPGPAAPPAPPPTPPGPPSGPVRVPAHTRGLPTRGNP